MGEPTSGRFVLRRAGPPDADDLGRFHVRVWRQAYRGIMPAAFLDALDEDESAGTWRTRLEVAQPDTRVLVAHDRAGELVGFATAGAPMDPEVAPWQLYALYVLADHYGSGLAHDLFSQAVGDRAAYLWVATDNGRARAFYAKHGFVPDGATDTHEGTGVAEIRMVRTAVAATCGPA